VISASFTSGTASFSNAVATVYNGKIISDYGETNFKLDLTTASGTVNAKDYLVTQFQSIASASFARFAATASYAIFAANGGGSGLVTGSTYPITASYALIALSGATGSAGGLVTGSTYPITASWALNSKTASFVANAITASTFDNGTAKLLGDNSITGASDIAASGTVSANNVSVNTLATPGGVIVAADGNGKLTSIATGSTLAVTASWAVNATTAKTATSASYLSGSATGSLLGTASFALNAKLANSASVTDIGNASNFYNVVFTNGDSRLYTNGGGASIFYFNPAGTFGAADIVATSITASMLGTASWAINTVNGGGSGASLPGTGSVVQWTASWAQNITASGVSGTVANALNAGFASQAVQATSSLSASLATNAQTASRYLPLAGGTVSGNTTFQGTTTIGSGAKLEYATGGNWLDDASGITGQGLATGVYQFGSSAGSVYLTGSAVSASQFLGTASYALAGGSAAAGALVTGSTVPITASCLSTFQPYTTLTTSSNRAITCSFATPYQEVTLPVGGVNYTITSSNHPSSGQIADVVLRINNSTGLTGSAFTFPASWNWGQAGAVTFITGSSESFLWLRARDLNAVSARLSL
jgi:hypothetical protein